ncbi:hypothetical protein ACIBG6_33215 [Streptomyces sp. NPDC050842]|uniref:hypothetical protein n=1 Tax=Streptomyces sp. NPDC050842 TaxID=3365636 RepID=UPI0037BC00C2
MFRSLRIIAALVAALLCALTLGAAAVPPPPPNPVWLRSFERVLSRGTQLADTYRPGQTATLSELAEQKSRLDELLSAVPADPPEQVAAAIARGQRLAERLAAIDVWWTLDDDAAAVADAALVPLRDTTLETQTALRSDMRKVARGVIEDVACGEVWTRLTNDQKERLNVPLESHDHLKNTQEAIEGQARSVLTEKWYPQFLNRAISWYTYAAGIHKKAFEVAEFLEGGQFTSTDGRAFYYYFHYCAKPPR